MVGYPVLRLPPLGLLEVLQGQLAPNDALDHVFVRR